MNVVWFKRDLRIEDNAALVGAADQSPILPLYILEPELWKQPDMSSKHYFFLCDCLSELNSALKTLGLDLIIKIGEAVDVLDDIHRSHKVRFLWSHQETWNSWTYARDRAVKAWCMKQDVVWNEPVQNGVIRRLRSRDGWAAKWYHQMKKPVLDAPTDVKAIRSRSDVLPSPNALGLPASENQHFQKGGRHEALKLLHSFLLKRGEGYTKEMSSPLSAFDSCSRLSTHIAFGTMSIREVFQACEERHQEVKLMPRGTKGGWSSALRSFSGRLRWHCHFIQKLEDQPQIEFQNMHPAYNGLREKEFNESYFNAWQTGRTGYPMVDACMRALHATGWLNFRMRAMVVSFASFHLWLHWRKTALYLAKQFTDYEPGIHYSQMQMQSGTTGINAIRIYNPVKQSKDHDPEGIFIRRWVPELKDMDQSFIHTPWQANSLMGHYPMPIVEEGSARKMAASKLYGVRADSVDYKETANKVARKHGSRKSRLVRTTAYRKTKSRLQRELPL